MNRYTVQLYGDSWQYTYTQDAESSDKAYQQAFADHAALNRPEPDSISISIEPKQNRKFKLRGI